ncbi:MAG: DUF1552 domain-containing protein [Myxococcota bacterium]
MALPFLEGLPERSAYAQSAKPVFGFFICTACGVAQKDGSEPETFWPTADGALTTASMNAFAAERSTGLLADHASRLLIVRGVNYPYGITGCGHAQGLVECLTSSKPNGTNNTATSSGPSIDTVIAQQVNPSGVDPLTLYSGMKGGYINEKLSFSAAGQVRAAEGNPYNVYQRLVGLIPSTGGNTGGGSSTADRLALRRKSVNDLVRAELNSLRSNSALSKADKDRLDQHFQAIRDVEVTMMGMGLQCSTDKLDVQAIQAMNSGQAFKANGKIEDVCKLQMDLVTLAFACNMTRVATLQCGDGTDATRYVIDGQTLERFHWISHRIQSDGSSGAAIAGAAEMHRKIDRLRMGTFKYLLDKWAQYNTPNGPLFDNAFVMWTSHVAAGASHSFRNLPIIIAGSAGGYLKQGQYVNAGNVGNNKLYNTLATAMGCKNTSGGPLENFGGADLQGGQIAAIRA